MSVNVFSYTGAAQTYTVPDGVFRVYVDLLGGPGAGGSGNQGARLQGFLRVLPGQVLNLYVGGQGALATNQIGAFGGFNGGGTGGSTGTGGAGGEGGGGASDIRVGGTALSNRICVAGGGGGSGRGVGNGQGGPGGGTTGAAGTIGSGTGETGGGGGTQAAGGAAGTSTGASSAATAGTATQGGFGSSNNTASGRGGGGGGGGYFCGGGGGSNGTNPSAGGGGGSSYIGSLTDAASFQGDAHTTGDGQITIYTGISITFNEMGSSTGFTVPSDVSSVYADLRGAQGGGAPLDVDGGLGGRLTGLLAVTPSSVLNIYAGGMGTIHNPNTNTQNNGGFNGGGNGIAVAASGASGAGGGGASDIRVGGTALTDRVCVAGAGGGISGGGVAGGLGGGTTGGTSTAVGTSVTAATGGTQAAGGTHGNSGAGGSTVATNGALGVGGNGASNSTTTTARGGGGGGAGYYGGGGGGSIAAAGSGSGGGGGSNFVGSLTSSTSIQGDIDGTGDGSVTLNLDTVTQLDSPGVFQRSLGTPTIFTAATSVDVPYPTVIHTDDIIVLYQATSSSSLDGSSLIGWNSGPSAVVSGVVRLSMWWKRASGLEAGEHTVTMAGASSGWLVMESYGGCVNSGTPYKATSVNQATSANTSMSTGGITPATSSDNGLIFQVAAYTYGTAQSGDPTVTSWAGSSGSSGGVVSNSLAARGIETAWAHYTGFSGTVSYTATLKTSSTWAAMTFDLIEQPIPISSVQSTFETGIDTYWTSSTLAPTDKASWFGRGEVKIGVNSAQSYEGFYTATLGFARTLIDGSFTWRMRADNLNQGPSQLQIGFTDNAGVGGDAYFLLGFGDVEPAGTGAILEAVINGGTGGFASITLPSESGPVWARITESGGNLSFWYSIDGREWVLAMQKPWAAQLDARSCAPFFRTLTNGATTTQANLHQFYVGWINSAAPHARPIANGLRYNQCPTPNLDFAVQANKLSTEDSTFEGGTVGTWVGGGTGAPTLTNSTVHADVGTKALLITWGTGSFPFAAPVAASNLIIGQRYFLKARVWVPVGHPDVKLVADSGAIGSPTSIKGAFTPISLSFLATATSHQMQLWPNTSPTSGQQCWVDSVSFREEIDFWVPGGSIPPIIEPSTDFADTATQSLKITWMGNGTLPGVNTDTLRSMECIVGHQYVVAYRHLATNAAYPMLTAILVGGSFLSAYSGFPNDTTRDGTWKTYIGIFTATATLHDLSLWPSTTPAIGQITYLDSVVFEDIDTFNPRKPIFDGNSAGGGWEVEPNASRSYLVSHNEAVAISATGAALAVGGILATDKASGTAATAGTALAIDSASGTAATSATIQSTDKVLGVAAATLLAVGADAVSGTVASSGAVQSTDSTSGSAATSGTALATDQVSGSAATSGAAQSATSASGTAVSSAIEQPQTFSDGSVASSAAALGRNSASGTQDSSGATTAQPDVSHTGVGGSTAQPIGQSFNQALAALLNTEATFADGSAASSGTPLASDPVIGSAASSGGALASDVLIGSALNSLLAVGGTRVDAAATVVSPLLGIDSVSGLLTSSALIEALTGAVTGVALNSTKAVVATFADGTVVSTGDAVFGFHGFVVSDRQVTTTAQVATSVFAARQAISGSLGVATASGSAATAGSAGGPQPAPHITVSSGQAQSATAVSALRALVTTALGTVLQTNNHVLPNPTLITQQVIGLVQALGQTLGIDVLNGALNANAVLVTPGRISTGILLDNKAIVGGIVDGHATATALLVAVSGHFYLWDGTTLVAVELLGIWDGTQLVHTFVDGVWDGTQTIPQGFVASTV